MSNLRKINPATPAPPRQRVALREAIAERKLKQATVDRVEKAMARGRQLLGALERELARFSDLDALILRHRAKLVTDTAQVGPALPNLKLPDNLVEARKARDEAAEQVAAVKFALKNLRAELTHAQDALQRAERLVGEAAQVILIDEATLQAAALKAAWSKVWHYFDLVSALPVSTQLLPADAVRILRMLPGIDHRQWAGGRNPAFARAQDGWRTWLDALRNDADAPMPELSDDGASSAPVNRVA